MTADEIDALKAMEETGMNSAMDEDDQEDIIDPEDPLYGLEQRLADLDIAEESKKIIRDKLMEAGNKIKTGLEARQVDLDTKIANQPVGKRK